MNDIERLLQIEKKYRESSEIEGEEFKYLSMRNSDIEFLLELAKKLNK